MEWNKIAVVGATGAVGKEVIGLLRKNNTPPDRIVCLASEKSKGKRIAYGKEELEVSELTPESFEEVDAAIFSAGKQRSLDFAPEAVKRNCVVIDNSSAFRMVPEVPLVVPEINPEDIAWHKGIIANPNCSTIIMVMVVAPIQKINPIKRIVACTYQAVSGSGLKGLEELEQQITRYHFKMPIQPKAYNFQIINNLFSLDAPIIENGYNQEEMKMVQETRKIMHLPNLLVTATCIRVPVARAHSIALHMELERPVDLERIKEVLTKFPGVKLVDHPEQNHFPMPLEASNQQDVLVGRIRRDLAWENGLSMFVSGDQLLKGAALNAFQILAL